MSTENYSQKKTDFKNQRCSCGGNVGGKKALNPTFRTLSCHREKLRREKIKVSIKINIRSEKRHLRNSKAPKMA
ncbi:hypothetical protein, partial [Microcystis aeruginosa]|uniref:hypothetical protein n=1 Tax=Microcystis aeruginosa TaxID=1126 RepID=UPI001D138DEF